MGSAHRIRGKIVVITGASSGIGTDVAFEIARLGGIPILLARRIDKLRQHLLAIEEMHHIKAHAFELDVSNPKEVIRIFVTIYEQIGNIDVLINNAGFALFKNADEATYEEVKAMFDVNVLGLISCTNAVLPVMKNINEGQIINIASIIGKIPTPKASAYAATKHAVLGFTNALRMEVSHTHVQITAVNPGPVKTEFFDLADESGTYTQKMGRMMLDSKKVARKIVSVIGTKRRELNLPGWMGVGGKCYALVPVLMEKTLGEKLFQK